MDGSASNRMYQNLVKRGRNLKSELTESGYKFYYTFTGHGMMINTRNHTVVIGTVRGQEVSYRTYYSTVENGSCVDTTDVISASDRSAFVNFLKKLSIV